jgi:hypothetical protein
MATFQAILSNNILKMIYAKVLGHQLLGKYVFQGFGVIIVANILVVIVLHLLG